MTNLTRVREARLLLNLATREYRLAILRANENGHSVRTIANEVGVSHGTIHQIIKKERATKKKNPPTT